MKPRGGGWWGDRRFINLGMGVSGRRKKTPLDTSGQQRSAEEDTIRHKET